MAAADASVNPHLAYVDSSAFGYVTTTFEDRHATAEFVTLAEPLDISGPVERRRLAFRIAYRDRAAPRLSALAASMIVPLKSPHG